MTEAQKVINLIEEQNKLLREQNLLLRQAISGTTQGQLPLATSVKQPDSNRQTNEYGNR